MKPRTAIVVVCDRLRADFVGPYGNAWVDTPALNSLAAQSLLFEHCVAESTDLRECYRSFWYGIHAATGVPADPAAKLDRQSLMTLATAKNLPSTLVTDNASLANDSLAESFHDCILLKDSQQPTKAAESVEDTRVARVFAEAAELAGAANEPRLIWIHADAMSGPWQAPMRLREKFVGDEDPDPPTFVDPPHRSLDKNVDPDELLALSQAYAAEVQVIDRCLFELLEVLDHSQLTKTTELAIVLTSPRGYPLGEHLIVGDGNGTPCLHAESLNVPLIVSRPGGQDMAGRDQRIMQNRDIYSIVGEWLQLELPDSGGAHSILTGDFDRRRAISVSNEQIAIRTPAWSWISSRTFDDSSATLLPTSLFAKPDDRYEVNDVATLCHQVADEFGEEAARSLSCLAEGKQLGPLSEDSVLVVPHE